MALRELWNCLHFWCVNFCCIAVTYCKEFGVFMIVVIIVHCCILGLLNIRLHGMNYLCIVHFGFARRWCGCDILCFIFLCAEIWFIFIFKDLTPTGLQIRFIASVFQTLYFAMIPSVFHQCGDLGALVFIARDNVTTHRDLALWTQNDTHLHVLFPCTMKSCLSLWIRQRDQQPHHSGPVTKHTIRSILLCECEWAKMNISCQCWIAVIVTSTLIAHSIT